MLIKTCRSGHRTWRRGDPNAWDILEVFRRTRCRTTVITCTHLAAALVADLAVQVLFRDRAAKCIGVAPLSREANMANREESGAVRAHGLELATQELYVGMPVHLTTNMDKQKGFVNGMEHNDLATKCLEVTANARKSQSIYPYSRGVDLRNDT